MDLFESSVAKESEPLASRMRPRTLDEYVGQEHILGKGRLLRRAIQLDQLSSIIFYGPPGTGKTTLARVIANTTKSYFSTLNAVLAGLKELETEINAARERRSLHGIKTILFIDEVHRWNKRQQDALLPWVENGTVILIGATTENPYFEVNAALVSRSRIFQLKKLEKEDLEKIAHQALSDKERGYGEYVVTFESGALEHLIDVASGDARSLLNALELAVETSVDSFPPPSGTEIYISKEAAEESIQKKAVLYDKEGDYHFDVISAFIKSIRGSDPDATLYWLARMVAAGEDPRFIFRRMLISASEDIGLADPDAIRVVEACASAFDRIGLPEGRFHLTEAALYLATTKKSNSTLAFFDALSDVEKEARDDVPNHLKDDSRDKDGFGHGKGYLYPHSYKDHWVSQQYLPSSLVGKIYYRPGNLGYEQSIKESVIEHRMSQLESINIDDGNEVLTWSPGDKKKDVWLSRAMSQRSGELKKIRDALYQDITIPRHANALIVNAGTGLLIYPALKMTPEGSVTAIVRKEEEKDAIAQITNELEELLRPHILIDESYVNAIDSIESDMDFSLIAARDILVDLEKGEAVLKKLEKFIHSKTVVLIATSIAKRASRVSSFLRGELKVDAERAEKKIYMSSKLSSWDDSDLESLIGKYIPGAKIEYMTMRESRHIDEKIASSWWTKSYSKHLDVALKDEFISALKDRDVPFSSTSAIIRRIPKETHADVNESTLEWQSVQIKTNK